jgi:hypothetical protein
MKYEESKIQQACKMWFDMQYREYEKLLIAIPNGGQRSAITASILKAEGVVSGVSDLFLFIPKGIYFGLAIEVKTAKGKQSANQKAWQIEVEKHGYRYEIVHSIDEFMELIKNYMS